MPSPIHREYGFGITETRDEGVVLPPGGLTRAYNFIGPAVTAVPSLTDPSIVNVTVGGDGIPADHHRTDQFTPTPAQTLFPLSATPVDPLDTHMSVNGQLQVYGTNFTVVGSTLSWLNVGFMLGPSDYVTIDYDV